MNATMRIASFKLRRSVLYCPASNPKAMEKTGSLNCDAVIFDLEDSVAPAEKAAARERLRAFLLSDARPACETVVRINALSSEWGTDDLIAARGMKPDAILLPKVNGPSDILSADEALDEMDAPPTLKLWAMVETPQALINAGPIAALGNNPAARLDCLVAGTNDLVKELRASSDRDVLRPLLLQIVVAARAAGIAAIDGVANDFRDMEVVARECAEARAMGYDGKTLIHPSQIYPANAIFAPTAQEVMEAREIVEIFSRPENADTNVVSLNGRMLERLHLEQAEVLLAQARAVEEAEESEE